MDDLLTVLGPDIAVSRGDLNRPSVLLQTVRLPSQAERLRVACRASVRLSGHGIIYTLTVRDAVQVAEWLRSRGLNVASYTGETGENRAELEQALLANRVKALVATTALGMGFDKPDLAFVIHYQAPGSVVAYYQQVGAQVVHLRQLTECCSAAMRRQISPTTSSIPLSRRGKKSALYLMRLRQHLRAFRFPS